MKLTLFYTLFVTISSVSCGTRIMKNFIVFLNGNNLAGVDEEILTNLIASPVLKTSPEKNILLNYSVKFPYLEDPINIPLSENPSIDHFRRLIRDHSLDVNVLPLTLLNLLVKKSPQFSDILMITNAQPENIANSLPDTLDIMRKKMIKVVVRTFDSLKNTDKDATDLYNSVQLSNITDSYHKINKLTKTIKSEMVFTNVLKRMLINDENKPTRNATITIINGMAFYKQLPVWDYALQIGIFLSEFNRSQVFSYNGQVMWIDDFSVMHVFENDYVVKIDLKAEYIPGSYIDILTEHCKNEGIRNQIDTVMEKYIRRHPGNQDQKILNEIWHTEAAKIKFPLKSLIKALIESSPRSVIYVLTDVHPTNTDLITPIMRLMREKNITVFVTYYGDKSKPDPEEYVEINKASTEAL